MSLMIIRIIFPIIFPMIQVQLEVISHRAVTGVIFNSLEVISLYYLTVTAWVYPSPPGPGRAASRAGDAAGTGRI
jgi:hypothetical protein